MLLRFPDAEHAVVQTHALDGGETLYVGSPHMVVKGLETPEAGKDLLTMVLKHATSPSLTARELVSLDACRGVNINHRH